MSARGYYSTIFNCLVIEISSKETSERKEKNRAEVKTATVKE